MTSTILFTSGSTKQPKKVTHSNKYLQQCIERSVQEMCLTESDTVLDVYPANTIAHYTITARVASYANATCISTLFNPYTYIKLFNEYRPTVISLIPRHYELLKLTKEWSTLDMSCVRYMVTGSGLVTQEMIDDFRSHGVQTVANWYGMTEMPPPVLVAYNSTQFNNSPAVGYSVEFTVEGECVVNGLHTGDIFDTVNNTFSHRKETSNGNTWKNNF